MLLSFYSVNKTGHKGGMPRGRLVFSSPHPVKQARSPGEILGGSDPSEVRKASRQCPGALCSHKQPPAAAQQAGAKATEALILEVARLAGSHGQQATAVEERERDSDPTWSRKQR